MIPLKSKKEIEIMKEGGRILAEILEDIKSKALEGVSTSALNKRAEELIAQHKAEPAFKGYQGEKEKKSFPAALCVSLNEVVVHGAPSSYILKKGDIVGLDLGLKYKGYYTDMALTLIVGSPNSPDDLKLVKTAKKALKFGIEAIKEGALFSSVSKTIENYVEAQGFSIITELCGHGIGKNLHEEPSIPNYDDGATNHFLRIKEGMVFCLEPMIAANKPSLTKAQDGFGFQTKDSSLTAHFEHTIAIVDGKVLVLTKA